LSAILVLRRTWAIFGMLLRRAGLSATAGHSCFVKMWTKDNFYIFVPSDLDL